MTGQAIPVGTRMAIKTRQKRTGGWQLYIVKCGDGSMYTGITNDLQRRLDKHNAGTASRYTRSRLPVELVYKERCLNKSSALKKELKIKALTRKEKERYIDAGSAARRAAKPRKRAKRSTT